MKKALWVNAAVLAAVLALGWFAYNLPRRDGPIEYPLSALKAGAVKHIRIEHRDRPPIVLEMKGGRWFLTAPLPARAETFNIRRLLAILDAKASSRLAAAELSRFDLNRPDSRLIVEGQSFSFGMVNAIAGEQYVLTGNNVYTVAPRYGAALPSDFTQLIERRLFADGEVPVGLELGDFSVRNSNGKWIVESSGDRGKQQAHGPSGSDCDAGTVHGRRTNSAAASDSCGSSTGIRAPGSLAGAASDLSQDDINRWVDDWRQASALHAAPFVHGKPVGEISVYLKNGKKLTLGILQREPELVLLRTDEKLQYYFVATVAKRLLLPPGAKH